MDCSPATRLSVSRIYKGCLINKDYKPRPSYQYILSYHANNNQHLSNFVIELNVKNLSSSPVIWLTKKNIFCQLNTSLLHGWDSSISFIEFLRIYCKDIALSLSLMISLDGFSFVKCVIEEDNPNKVYIFIGTTPITD